MVEGGSYGQSDVTTIINSGGSGLSIGFQGKVPTGSISGSFPSNIMKNMFDMYKTICFYIKL